MRPKRIQMKNTLGWRMPEGAIYVGKSSPWENYFQVSTLIRFGPEHEAHFGRPWDHEGRISAVGSHDMHLGTGPEVIETYVRESTPAEQVELFRLTLTHPTPGMLAAWPSRKGRFFKTPPEDLHVLRGHDLACWCPLHVPCHADVLLELADGSGTVGEKTS